MVVLYFSVFAKAAILIIQYSITSKGECMNKKERRAGNDRRTSKDRRQFQDSSYKGPERRNATDRREEKDRRKA